MPDEINVEQADNALNVELNNAIIIFVEEADSSLDVEIEE